MDVDVNWSLVPFYYGDTTAVRKIFDEAGQEMHKQQKQRRLTDSNKQHEI